MGGATFIGRVVSNRMQKTVVVAVNYVVWVPKYKVYEKRVARHMAHDENQRAVVGDVVKIEISRKRSKNKSYSIADTIRAMPVYKPLEAEKLVAQRDSQKPGTAVEAAQARLRATQLRLAAVKRMLEKELKGTAPLGAAPSSSGQHTGSRPESSKRSSSGTTNALSGAAALGGRKGFSGLAGGAEGDRSSSGSMPSVLGGAAGLSGRREFSSLAVSALQSQWDGGRHGLSSLWRSL